MDREILFRGKRVIDGKWAESSCPLGEIHSGTVTYDFAQDSVCQYTGLTDRNGRKIFEGDIVDCREKRGAAFWHCRVVWNDVKARFDVIAMDCAFPMCLDDVVCAVSVDGPDYEVIGNIFDNPELMERIESVLQGMEEPHEEEKEQPE